MFGCPLPPKTINFLVYNHNELIAGFVGRIRAVGTHATLSELVLVPAHRDSRQWRDETLYAVVEVLVQ